MGTRRTSALAWATEHLVDIVIAVGVAVAIVALLYAIRALTYRACKKLGPTHPFASVFLDVARKTRLWFLVALALELVQSFLHPPQDVARTIGVLFTIAAALQVAIWARRLVLGMIALRVGDEESDQRGLASAMGIIKLLLSLTVFTIAGIVILDNIGVNVTGLVAGLGIGGIAIGLAAQGIFSDLFAALSIIFDKPFRVGDVINYQGKEGPITGTVKTIGLKSTRILALTGELRIIGNTQLLAQEVTNFTGRQMFRFALPIGVIYQTDPAKLATIPDLLKGVVESSGHRYVNAWLVRFGPSSIDYDFLFEVDQEDSALANKALESVALGVLKTFAEQGIEFAYPTQTTFTAAPDGKMIMPYPQVMPVVDRSDLRADGRRD
jgi:small-conductance mechanosensitive channel